MKCLLFVMALTVSAHSFAGDLFSQTKVFDLDTSDFKIEYAQYGVIPTKTEVRQIPGCDVTADRHPVDCEETVVLEKEAVVSVIVTYKDPTSVDEYQTPAWFTVHFRPEDIPAVELATLRSVSWRTPFSKIPSKVAKKNFKLEIKNVRKEIQVIDEANSTICPRDNNGFFDCEDVIVYKPAMTTVKEVTVLKK
ncbi:hypothetical protein ACJVC5_05060 [Peredibacter sp. HCB2-198]|uniref:hypothetical protein n=1 Tax=Peredibacter sp. HCB2-198 TaxID=3383025 RepID=UPI0038B53F56